MPYNYSKLLGKITEKYGTQMVFSKVIGLSEHTLSRKLNCQVGWKQDEIVKVCDALDLSQKDISDYFFTQ